MIDEKLEIRDRELSYRSVIGYYFARWFDEPFTVDVINRICPYNMKAVLTTDEVDKEHIDYYIIDRKDESVVNAVDSKTVTHNFKYRNNNDKDVYTDAIPMGEKALIESCSSYISFISYGYIYIVNLNDIRNTTPIKRKDSPGQNLHHQTMIHYDVDDLKHIESTVSIEIPKNMYECYYEAYQIYMNYKESMYSYLRDSSTFIDSSTGKMCQLNNMRNNLIPIIHKFNLIYDELPKIDTIQTLNDIMSIIG